MKITVIMALWQRPKIATIALDSLREHNVDVLAVGSEGDASRDLAVSCGASYIEHPNTPLGAKWNAALMAAKSHSPDAVMVIGSDDIINEATITAWIRALEDGYEYMGFVDGYIYCPMAKQLIRWRGYKGHREGEPLGSGRCYSSALLDRAEWKLWNDHRALRLDYLVTKQLQTLNPKSFLISMSDAGIRHLGVKSSTNMKTFQMFLDNNRTLTSVGTHEYPNLEFLDPAVLSKWYGEIGGRILALSEET